VHLKETGEVWDEALANVGEIWFGIKIPRQGGNPLFDMMGSMLFGGSGTPQKSGTPRSSTPKPKVEAKKAEPAAPPAPPPTMDLD
jgi:golgi to ER traffic protein 4